jgi:protein TonB
MAYASYHHTPEDRRRRARGIVLALIVEGLVAVLLLHLGGAAFLKHEQPRLTTFDVTPIGPPVSKQAAKTRVATQKKKTVTTASAAPPAHSAPPKPPIALKSKLIELGPEDFAASDISKIKSANGNGDDSGSGKDSVAAYGPGEGPGGGSLYNAEWYREPTDAQLGPYLPKNVATGSAIIECKTVPNYHVENCRSLGESPAGNGLSRAMREASWQFLVRPPRVNGKALVGAWVRIRYDLTVGFINK